MAIIYHESTATFHLYNRSVSYIMAVLQNGHLGQLYYGRRIHDAADFSHLQESCFRAMTSWPDDSDPTFSLNLVRLEYPVYGSSDFRRPAVEVRQSNGSTISDFVYKSHRITRGKSALPGLPATYTEAEEEAETLTVTLKDALTGVEAELSYTIFAAHPAIARSARLTNKGGEAVHLRRAMSLCLDLPECGYEWLQLSGAWARERHIVRRPLAPGLTAVDSVRGCSSHEQNPFAALLRPGAGEEQGEVLGISLVYSGNFSLSAEVDAFGSTRVLAGINPFGFDWKLAPGEQFQTPEAVLVYSNQGLNGMSQTFHTLYRTRLARGEWRDRPRPILINNWEATYFDFTEARILDIAAKAKECGVELFVLDDGWFGQRCTDRAGLGDWTPNPDRLPNGIAGLAEQIEALGMKFGLWFEPEMVNQDSDLYRAHPDWILKAPGRKPSFGRHQLVLDFSRQEVVDNLYKQMSAILGGAKVSYVKWDMNRCITECYSAAFPADRQGEVFHRYILGVYSLYERLTAAFPHVLFESCASGGARFDPGLLYYAPQCWTSDDSDAVERLYIQYGTSLCYPVSSMGAHVSVSPNHQVMRSTPLSTRANVACFGTFGYELDLNRLTEAEIEQVKAQIAFMKEYRSLLQFGRFYRLKSPFEGDECVWMAVSEDQSTAIVGWYRILNRANKGPSRVRLMGLDPERKYVNSVTGKAHWGDELMYCGLITTDPASKDIETGRTDRGDFESRLYILQAD